MSASPQARARAVAMQASEARSDGTSSYVEAVESLLAAVIPADLVLYNDIDSATGRAHTHGSEAGRWRWLDECLGELSVEHPLINSFLSGNSDIAPRRVSDLLGDLEFRQTRTYCELFRQLGARYQVSMPTAVRGVGYGRGWAFNRAGRDFTDTECDMLTLLQPHLVALDAIVFAGIPETMRLEPEPLPVQRHSDAQAAPLTARETEVLTLLAYGWTAARIGRHLRISPGTVRKHLEHTYSKLGTHDRLLAVQRATRQGLLDPRPN